MNFQGARFFLRVSHNKIIHSRNEKSPLTMMPQRKATTLLFFVVLALCILQIYGNGVSKPFYISPIDI